MAEDTGAPSQPTRRSALNWLLGVGVAGWLGSIMYPVLRYLTPLSDSGTGGPVKLSAEEVTKVDKESFVIARSGTRKIIVINANGELRALDAKCTHEGCTVQYVPGDGVIWCACHNGKFDLDGRVLSGPPPRPLNTWVVSREGDDIQLTPEGVA